MIKYILLLSTLLSIAPKVKAAPIVKVSCEDYKMEEVYKKRTKSYEFSLCINPEESNHAYYYLGGMRKNNSDYYTLLPVTNWGLDYFVVEVEEFSYILEPSCGPNNIKVFYCKEYTPSTFSIYQGKKELDSEQVIIEEE